MTSTTMTSQEEAYESVRGVLYNVVRRFRCMHGGEVDALVSEANYNFVTAYNSYKPASGTKFSTWVYIKVWRGLQNYLRIERKHRRNAAALERWTSGNAIEISDQWGRDYTIDSNEALDGLAHDLPPCTFLTDFMGSVSEEARDVIDLLMDMPNDIAIPAIKSGGKPANVKRALRDHLRNSLKWTHRQIRESFTEIEEALKS